MRLEKVIILNCPVSSNDILTLEDDVVSYARNNKYRTDNNQKKEPLVIFTPNTEQLVLASKQKWFQKLLDTASVSLPDSVGVIWGIQVLEKRTLTRIPGIEFMDRLVAAAERNGMRIALLGGRKDVALRAQKCLVNKYPKLISEVINIPEIDQGLFADAIGKLEHPEGKLGVQSAPALQKIIDDSVAVITKKHLQMVFVALGAPKQELLIALLKEKLRNTDQPVVLMAVGGSFDVIAGDIKRAPKWLRSLGFEWVWRLMKEPWRVKRQTALLIYIGMVVKEWVRRRMGKK